MALDLPVPADATVDGAGEAPPSSGDRRFSVDEKQPPTNGSRAINSNGKNGTYAGNGKNGTQHSNGKGRIAAILEKTSDFPRSDDDEPTIDDLKHRLQKKFHTLPGVVDDCIAQIESGEDPPVDADAFMDRFKEAFLAHATVEGMIGRHREWMQGPLGAKLACLQFDVGHDQPVLVGTDGFVGRQIGEGSFGVVYEVVHQGNEGVLKLFRPKPGAVSNIENARQRFISEVDAMETMNGEGTPRLLLRGELNPGEPYFVMERIHGWTLKDILAQAESKAFPRQAGYDILTLLALCLESIHQKGIIHRDVKPSNAMLSHTGSVSIIDLGLRGSLEHDDGVRMTASRDMLGTVLYMSPEQIKNPMTAGKAADRYSFGCVAYELLAGHVPFPANSAEDAIDGHKKREPDLSVLPEEDREIIADLLQKDPKNRRLTMMQVAAHFFERGAMKSHYLTMDDLLKNVHSKRRLQDMPVATDKDTNASRQGSTIVADASQLYEFFRSQDVAGPDPSLLQQKRSPGRPWYRRRRTIAAGTGAAILGTAAGIYALTHRSNNADVRPADPNRDKSGNVVPVTSDDSKKDIEVQVKGPRTIDFRPSPEPGKNGTMVLFPDDPARSIEIPEGVCFTEVNGVRGSFTKAPLDENLKKRIIETHGEPMAIYLNDRHIYTYRRMVGGVEMSFVTIEGAGNFFYDGDRSIALTLTVDSGKMNGLVTSLSHHIVNKDDASRIKRYRDFFDKLDVSSALPLLPVGGTYNKRNAAQVREGYVGTANLHVKKLLSLLQGQPAVQTPAPSPRKAQLSPDHFRDFLRTLPMDAMADSRERMQRTAADLAMHQYAVALRSHAVISAPEKVGGRMHKRQYRA